MDDLVVDADGLTRCGWGVSAPELQPYHDSEWGRPVGDDDQIYEKLCLEGFQAGLSWLTILRKREGFRAAFARFDPTIVAGFDATDIDRLLSDRRIVRNRGKITAALTNARATVALRERETSLAAVVWRHRPATSRVPRVLGDLPATTPESTALSKELRGYGFAFVGPTTVYAMMQALGVVNDHVRGCHWRELAEAARAVFTVPE